MIDPPTLRWSTPLQLTRAGRQYLKTVMKLTPDYKDTDEAYGKRLAFFLDYLEHADDMLARDAYDEFARAPYAAVRQIKDRLDRDKLVGWLNDTTIAPNRRRLYFTLLGVIRSRRLAGYSRRQRHRAQLSFSQSKGWHVSRSRNAGRHRIQLRRQSSWCDGD